MHLICLRETWSPLGEIKLLTWDSTTKLTRSNTAADHDVKSTTDDRGKIQRAPSTGVSPHIILPTINTYLHMITCFRIHTKRPKALSLSGFFDQHTKILFFYFPQVYWASSGAGPYRTSLRGNFSCIDFVYKCTYYWRIEWDYIFSFFLFCGIGGDIDSGWKDHYHAAIRSCQLNWNNLLK